MLFALTTILITGGLTIAPAAYSTENYGGNHDDSGCNDDSHDDSGDCNPEPDCECKKPTVFSVIYNGPGIEDGTDGDAEVTVEIYKKANHIGDKNPLLTFEGIFDGESITIDSHSYGKGKVHSNTVYRVIQNDVEIAVVSIHTSCSDDMLFVGNTYSDNDVTLTVESGTDKQGNQSIFLPVDPICNEVPTTTLEVTKDLSPEDDLGTFILQIDGADVTTEVGNGGTSGPLDVIPGLHTVGEIAGVGTDLADYTSTIGGDCNADGSIDLVEGDNAVCTITNELIIPATITLKKVITQDNTDEVNELPDTSGFNLYIQNIDGSPEIEITEENQVVPPGTYTFHETGPDNFEFVLITGDTGCPTMDEDMDEFTLGSDQHLTCVVYNDDDADTPVGGEGGVFFARNSLQMRLNMFGFIDPEFSAHSCENLPSMVVRPCITEDSNGNLLIVDPSFDQQGGHLATVSATVQPAGPGSEIDCHSPSGIELFNYPDANVGGPGEDGIPGTLDDDDDLWVRGFSIPCNLSGGDGGIFFVGYTIVQTEIVSPWATDLIDNDGDTVVDEVGEGDGINNDMDCTEDLTGDHFFGDKTDNFADDCFDNSNVVKSGFTESIDEDSYNNIDDDIDGFIDEDP